MTKSPLIWLGGKSRLAPAIIANMAPHDNYVEVFGGAAHVISQKTPAKHEVYNDIDGNLVNFLLVARADPEKLCEACETLPYSRQLYERWRVEDLPTDPFQKAVRWFYLNRSAISGGNNIRKTGWRHSTKSNANAARGYASACERIKRFGQRIRGVMIEQIDFRRVIEKYDSPDTLFYCDPPYFGCEHYYLGGFTDRDHYELSKMLSQIKGKAIISYYDHPSLYRYYGHGWRFKRIEVSKQIVSGSKAKKAATEILIMNYDLQLSLFDQAEEMIT